MKHFLLSSIAMLLCISNASAQSIGHTYNRHINQAELKITDGKYAEALQHYDEAFATDKIEFAVDLYNACTCAIKLKNTSKALLYADRLTEKGVGKKFFIKAIFRSYSTDPGFKKITEKAEQVKNEKAATNTDYTEKLIEFFTLDTTYNRIRYKKYYDQHVLPDTLQKLFTKNTKDLLAFVKAKGFYSENKLGADIGNDTIIKSVRKADIVLLHYLEMGNDKELIEEIKNILLDNLNKGTIKYYHINNMIAMTAGIFGDIGEWAFKINDCKIYRKTAIESEWQDKIDNYRDLYCMNNMADFEKIISYKYSVNSDFEFKYYLIKSPVSDMEYFLSAFNVIAKIKNCQS